MTALHTAPSALVDRLVRTARHYAREAIRLADAPWSELSALDVAYRCGSVVELLAKAVLARRDERLLVKRDVHTHLFDVVAGAPSRAADLSTTLDASVSVTLAAHADQRIAPREKDARNVLTVRNAAVHLAAAPDGREQAEVVAEMVTAAEVMLGVLAVNSRQFWDVHHGFAMDAVRRQLDSVAVEARALVNRAQQKHKQRLSGMPDAVKAQLIAVLQLNGAVLDGSDVQIEIDCPACKSSAYLQFEGFVDVEDDHGEALYTSGYLLQKLACPVCQLRLDGDQVEALELPDFPDPYEITLAAAREDIGEYAD